MYQLLRDTFWRMAGLATAVLERRWPSKRAEGWRRTALYRLGRCRCRVDGLSGWFVLDSPGDFNHLVGHYFEAEHIRLFLEHLQPDDTVYEVGGHIGTWSVFIARKLSRGRVVVFEPHPDNRSRLRENVALNRLSNVTVLEYAASGSAGQAEFGVRSEMHDGRHSLLTNVAHSDVIRVSTIALDDVPGQLSIPAPTAMKIDCEGGEYEVIRGMSELLESGAVRVIFLELHEAALNGIGQSSGSVLGMLAEHGYRPVQEQARVAEQMVILKRSA